MITREQIKQKYDAVHEHFNLKDFLGLSALIFGLLMSNTSFDKSQKISKEAEVEKQKINKPAKKSKKSAKSKKTSSQKKVLKVPKNKRQRVTAAKDS